MANWLKMADNAALIALGLSGSIRPFAILLKNLTTLRFCDGKWFNTSDPHSQLDHRYVAQQFLKILDAEAQRLRVDFGDIQIMNRMGTMEFVKELMEMSEIVLYEIPKNDMPTENIIVSML
jgi:type IV secretory pathway TrbF-like protein